MEHCCPAAACPALWLAPACSSPPATHVHVGRPWFMSLVARLPLGARVRGHARPRRAADGDHVRAAAGRRRCGRLGADRTPGARRPAALRPGWRPGRLWEARAVRVRRVAVPLSRLGIKMCGCSQSLKCAACVRPHGCIKASSALCAHGVTRGLPAARGRCGAGWRSRGWRLARRA